jgi:hypothetical protein
MLDDIIKVIQESETTGLLKGNDDVELAGFSGTKLLGTLQRLVKLFSTQGNTCYLEIGVFQGLTLCLSMELIILLFLIQKKRISA